MKTIRTTHRSGAQTTRNSSVPSACSHVNSGAPAAASAPKRRSSANGDERGLTTLEWLLIVAAVAALAAVGVTLVRTVVADNAENVADHSARQAAASLAVTQLTDQWRAENPTSAREADQINRRYMKRCRHLSIIYSDIALDIAGKHGIYDPNNGGWNAPPTCTTY